MPAQRVWTVDRTRASSNEDAHFEVRAGTWAHALAQALDHSGRGQALSHLVCEVLPNGTVIARDARSGERWVLCAGDVAEDDRRFATALGAVITAVFTVAAVSTGLAHAVPML